MAFNLAALARKCIHTNDFGTHRVTVCSNTPLLQDRPHGWLCKEHAADEDLRWRVRLRSDGKIIPRLDQDAELVRGIIISEFAIIGAGKVQTTRFGAVAPIYLKTWQE